MNASDATLPAGSVPADGKIPNGMDRQEWYSLHCEASAEADRIHRIPNERTRLLWYEAWRIRTRDCRNLADWAKGYPPATVLTLST